MQYEKRVRRTSDFRRNQGKSKEIVRKEFEEEITEMKTQNKKVQTSYNEMKKENEEMKEEIGKLKKRNKLLE